LGQDDKDALKQTFSAAITIHIFLAFFILLLSETIGLWFLENKLVIPLDRMNAARIVYQLSIISTMIGIIQLPYTALIIAHERMTVFAYVEIVNTFLRLGIVYLLAIGNYDKLILYAVLVFVVSLIMRFVYGIYCKRNFLESKYKFEWNKKVLYPMLKFSGWATFGNFAGLARDQGLNILLNLFFGLTVNAARSIAFQVKGAVFAFIDNFIAAVNPQLVKNYAAGMKTQMMNLAFNASKLSFLLFAILSVPVIMENKFILTVWLKTVPDYTSIFLQIIIIQSLISSMITPMAYCIHATGNVKFMYIVNGILYTSILPVSFILFKLGFSPAWGFLVNLVLQVIGFWVWLLLLHKLIDYSIKEYLLKVFAVCLCISGISVIFPIIIHFWLNTGLLRLGLVTILFAASVLILSYYFVIDRDMRSKISIIIKNRLKSMS
jgi:O-antigen/teichoic acid export membrane protein